MSEKSRSVVLARKKALDLVRAGGTQGKFSFAPVGDSQDAQGIHRMVTFQRDHAPPSSAMRQGHDKALSEARKALDYLERVHPDWLPPSA